MDVYLFPMINATLFPKTTKPLHIFEPRYLEMVRQAIETATPVALGFIDDPAQVTPLAVGSSVPYIRGVAGFGNVQIIEERTNGTLLIFLHGLGKCRVGHVKQSQPFLICDAELMPEDFHLSEPYQGRLATLRRILMNWISKNIPDAGQRDLFIANMKTPEDIVSSFTAYLVRDYDLQQVVLETDRLEEKIQLLERLTSSGEIST